MTEYPLQDITFNIRYDAPDEIWQKIPAIYERMPGWIGFAEDHLPYWYSTDESGLSKTISASVEPAGLQISGFMPKGEWDEWTTLFRQVASAELGFDVGDVAEGFE